MAALRTARLLFAGLVAALVLVAAFGAAAQNKPKRVVTIVHPKVDGKGVKWWANRARANGERMRALQARTAAATERLRHRIEPLQARYEHAAILAAVVYGVDAETLIRKGRCESSNWTAFYNSSGASGPWQFLPSTWRTTPLAAFSPYDPEAAALAAAWMHAQGRGGEWVCQ